MHFNIVNETAHRAMSDVYATYRVYESLLALEK
jgi:DNA polymerase III epsilon subunit-like protein